MVRKNPSKWPNIRRVAIEAAERLTRQTPDLPIDLGAIAAQRSVKRVQFRQLLVTGGISVVHDGFVIYVGCDADKGKELTERFTTDGTGAGLPPLIRVRARFTIAHEIAHTFLYNIKASPPTSKVSLKVPASLGSLEQTCNFVAGALLIPEWLLLRDFRNSDFLDPRELRGLAAKALVSGETLVRRFSKLHEFPHPEGIIATLQREASGIKILAVSRHYRFAGLVPDSGPGPFLTSLAEHPDLIPNGGEFSEVETSVDCAGGTKMRFVLRCESIKMRMNKAFFLTVAPLG